MDLGESHSLVEDGGGSLSGRGELILSERERWQESESDLEELHGGDGCLVVNERGSRM